MGGSRLKPVHGLRVRNFVSPGLMGRSSDRLAQHFVKPPKLFTAFLFFCAVAPAAYAYQRGTRAAYTAPQPVDIEEVATVVQPDGRIAGVASRLHASDPPTHGGEARTTTR